MPSVRDVVLFLEDDELSDPVKFRRDLNSLMQLPDAHTVRGLVLGRFQNASGMAREDLEAIVATIPSLAGKPIVANVDFGHTTPLITFPIGGRVELHVANATRITFPSTSVNTGTSRHDRTWTASQSQAGQGEPDCLCHVAGPRRGDKVGEDSDTAGGNPLRSSCYIHHRLPRHLDGLTDFIVASVK
ncbi:hypothetical protein PCC79_17245 [Propioniciclava soli]|uniref:LD-carboxypeptidase C-terminal domain-containing protein n=1 Tax=Propioniciclava soli TaxID=2775081 RepID=A0ABZ3C751_9ACTN